MATCRAWRKRPSPASNSRVTDWQYALRWCWLPGTVIELADHSYRPIEQIRPGDSVRTKLGTVEKVAKVSVRPVEEEIVELEVAGLGKTFPLRLTTNHKLPSIRSAKLKPGRIKPWKYTVEDRPAGELCTGDYLFSPLPLITGAVPVEYPGWLIGLYLAEGNPLHTSGGLTGVRFTLGADDEKVGILQRLLTICKDVTGWEQKSYQPPQRPDLRLVSVHDSALAVWLDTYTGRFAQKKKLAEQVFSFDRNTLLDILAGWLDGDGCLSTNGTRFEKIAGTTSSQVLALQLMRLAQMLGFTPSLCCRKNPGFGGDKSKFTDVYQITFNKVDSIALSLLMCKGSYCAKEGFNFDVIQEKTKAQVIHDGKIYGRIKKISRSHYKGPVHNMEIENEHSYIANLYSSANCEYICLSNGTYRQAIDRILSYFITDVQIDDASDDDKEKWTTFLEETIDVKNSLHTVGLDGMVYGNSFTSVLPTFKRYLSCPRCGFEAPLNKVYNEPTFRFRWANYEFHATCPKCHASGQWRHTDRRHPTDRGFRIKRWNPHEMELLWDPLTDECSYIWKIPEDYRKMIREGHLYHLERANWEVIQAIKHNNYMLFDKDVIYHMREDALAGVRNRGWGISRVLANFRQAWYVQVLHRYNEAIALDYVIPFRLITPVPGDKSTGADPLLNLNAGDFMAQVMGMVARRRQDPAAWFSLPFPVQYQAIGGDATQLAPHELLEQAVDTLLNAIGVPAELYKGSLTVQSAPAALRLFESSWVTVPHNLNGWLRFIVKQVSQLLNWDKVTAKLMRVTHADDVQRQMSKLQLMMGGQISQSTGLKAVGLDYHEEVDKMMDDQRYQAEESAKLQEEMEHASQMSEMAQPPQQGQPGAQGAPGATGGDGGAGGAAGGAPAGDPNTAAGLAQQSVVSQLPVGPNEKISPEELEQRATYVASQLMGMSESQKDGELIKLKKVNPTLHSLVRSKMDDMRRQAQQQGGAQVLQQQFGKAGSAAITAVSKTSLLRHRGNIKL